MGECRLLCIDPAQAGDFWPHVAPLIERACKRGLHDFAGAELAAREGRALLWIAWDDFLHQDHEAHADGRERPDARERPDGAGELLAAATTELHRINGRKLCFIAALGGRERARWLHLIEGIENYARAEGCAATIIMGRPGWERVLNSLHEAAARADGRERPDARERPGAYRTRGTIIERTL